MPPRFVTILAAFFAIVLGACSRPGSSLPGKPSGNLRVVSWNLQWFPGRNPDAGPDKSQAHMAEAKNALAELKPDILLLQEVRDWAAVEELCSAVPGLKPHVVSQFAGRPQNQAVASSLGADSAWSAQWKAAKIDPPRGYSFAALKVPDGRYILTYSLHLKSNLGSFSENVGKRSESARQLTQHVSEMLATYQKRGACAVVVGGDMNTSLDDSRFDNEPTLRAWQAAGFFWTHHGVPFGKRTTIPADDGFPDNCFDHIFTLGLGKPKATVVALPALSDHNPVIVDIDLAKADFQPKLDVAAAEDVIKSAPKPAPPETLAETLNANDDPAIRAAIGKIAKVRGRIDNVSDTASISFLNFAGNQRGQFVAIVRKESRETVAAPLGGDLQSLRGKTIEVSGPLELFKQTPEIIVKSADQIAVLAE